MVSLAMTVAIVGTALTLSRGNASSGFADGGGGSEGSSTLPGPTVDLALAPGEYSYRRVSDYSSDGIISTTAVWWALDDSGRVRSAANDDTRYRAGQIPTDTGSIAYLSTDPDVLRAQMIERTSPGGQSPEPMDQFSPGPGQSDHLTAGLIRAIGELLDDVNTSPALRAALCQVAAGLEGVQITQGAIDPVGRPAVLLSVTTEESLHQWWFDPSSLQLLARQDGPPPSAGGGLQIVESAGIVSGDDSSEFVSTFIAPPVHEPMLG